MIHTPPPTSAPGTIPVTVLGPLDTSVGRRTFAVPERSTVEEIALAAFPQATATDLAGARVVLVTPAGRSVVDRADWSMWRPRRGVHVVVRLVPQGNFLRSILQILVFVVAGLLGQWWALGLGTALGIGTTVAQGLITAGVSIAGNLLINALVPPPQTGGRKESPTYSTSAWRNPVNPSGVIPCVLGAHRWAPPYWSLPYTEIVGDDMYVRGLFCLGYGPLDISEHRFGEASVDKYDEVEMEIRAGYPDDEPVTLVPQQIVEEPHSVELKRELPRDDKGKLIPGGVPEDDPVTRWTARDAVEAALIFSFPQGLQWINSKGKKRARRIQVRHRIRAEGETDWIDLPTLDFYENKGRGFFRQVRFALPERGPRYEIELTRLTNESASDGQPETLTLVAVQSVRPEYPVNYPHPLALVAMRIKATHQLNGQIDDYNVLTRRICPDWDQATESWITRPTSSPASLYRFVLQSTAAAFREPDAAIDLELLADWHGTCAAKGLEYERVHDGDASLGEVLAMVAAAGRGAPRHDGLKWSVVIDRPQGLVVDHVSARNSRDFRWKRSYFQPPDAFRVPFRDRTNDYKAAERIVPWPGHDGAVLVTEQLDMPGVTDPAQIWREARRRQYELEHRPDSYTVAQDGAARVATRGDQVAASVDLLEHTQSAARVKTVAGALVVLDDVVEMEAGTDYAIRFRRLTEDDPIGESIVRPVRTRPGTHQTVEMLGAGPSPVAGDIVHFGPAGADSYMLIVRSVERGEDFSQTLTLVAAAPIIDELTDAEVPPAWNGRVGAEIGGPAAPPAIPVLRDIRREVDGDLTVMLQPGPAPGAAVGSYEVRHRLAGAPGWEGPETTPAATAAAVLEGYSTGDQIEIEARAISVAAVVGAWTATIDYEVESPAELPPDVATLSAVRLASGVRRYSWTLGPGDAEDVIGFQLRARPGTGWAWADLAALHIGLVTSAPWETSEPPLTGVHTIGIVAVDVGDAESGTPRLIEVDLGAASDILAQRLEAGLGWPGTLTDATIGAGGLTGPGGLPSAMSYRLPVIDLGADLAIDVAATAYGVAGTATLTMRTGLAADGLPVDLAGPLGAVTARYVEITVAVSNAAAVARLADLVTTIRSA